MFAWPSEYYGPRAFLCNEYCSSALIGLLFEVSALNFQLIKTDVDLDNSWTATRAYGTFGARLVFAPLSPPPPLLVRLTLAPLRQLGREPGHQTHAGHARHEREHGVTGSAGAYGSSVFDTGTDGARQQRLGGSAGLATRAAVERGAPGARGAA